MVTECPSGKRWLVLIVALGAGLASGAVASANMDREVPLGGIVFADGLRSFCSDGGDLSVGVGEIDPSASGFSTARGAAEAFLDEMHRQARGELVTPELRGLYQEALRPMASLDFTEEIKISDSVTHFDLPSDVEGFLDGRLVVVRFGDGYFPVEDYVCSTSLVDHAKWESYEDAAQELEVSP